MATFQVEVRWDGEAVPGVTAVSPLRQTTEVVTYRDISGGLYKLPGRTDTAVVVVQRGLDGDVRFDRWARGPGLKKDVELRLSDPAGGDAVRYLLRGCWVCEYAVAPDVTTGAVTESLTLSVNRWERLGSPVARLADDWARLHGTAVQHVRLGELVADRLEETERRVDALLADAQASDAVLLFDEADALFSRRTEVADARDRYQATSLDTVLDRLARFPGAVFVADPDAEPEGTEEGSPPHTRR